ncbi:MAG: class I SAM-dependent methyltransferase [Methylacidiphilales bacterium]|nr:class I SAM-dependent methyltransferase [Candidatus Methylacidiphilales bacterium]
MSPSNQLKTAIRERWSRRERVEGWVQSNLNAEFNDPVCRKAWLSALQHATAGGRVGHALDLGTGPGTIAQLWAELGYFSTGIDFSPGMLEAGRAAAANRGLAVDFQEGDAEAPPFVHRRFDVISSRFVLFTLPHPGYAVRRWVELLRTGGTIVLIGHDKTVGLKKRTVRPKKQPKRKPEKRHEDVLKQLPFVHHTPGDLIVLLEAVGLRDIQRMPMDDVVAARAAFARRNPGLGVHPSPPFIIVGRK